LSAENIPYSFFKTAKEIVHDFEQIPVNNTKKIKVGIVGEIYIKFAPLGNNCLEEFLRSEDVEVVIPGLTDMILFMCDHHIVDTELYHVRYKKYIASAAMKAFIRNLQNHDYISAVGIKIPSTCTL
jgi:predicted nucleotide-binding protein (sugar kinase/HSP70/actin superfamily)